jgi:hypothetical protein
MDLSRSTVTGWRKATYSSGNGGACIEVGNAGHSVAVRDSKNPAGPKLGFTPDSWRTFTRRIQSA